MKPRVAVIDDEPRMREIIAMLLRREGYDVELFESGGAFLKWEGTPFDLVVTDLKMPGIGGLDVVSRCAETDPDLPVVVLTAHGSVELAMDAVRRGAWDFLQKPFDNDQVRATVRRALEKNQLARQNRRLRAEVRDRYDLDDLVAESPIMRQQLDLARRAAASPATVLITGDSGTGKERVARAVHYWSDRVGESFVAVNCKAFASGVLESELFGHEKGAFTGATSQRRGVFERARGGTVFLDEIGEVDADFQAKLLRVLQEREVQRVGGDGPIPIDIRVVAATNRNLRDEIEAGNFREDLYFRLAVIPIELAPLAARREDILPLARTFLIRANRDMGRSISGWSDEVEAHLIGHDWPGNVRELENAIERAVVLCREDELQLEDVVLGENHRRTTAGNDGEDLNAFLDRKTSEKIRETLATTGGNRTEASEILGIDRTTLYRMMKRLGVDV